MEEEISLVELFNILKKHMTTIIFSVIVTTLLAGIYTFVIATPMYEATTEMLVSQSSEENSSMSRQDIDTSLQLINTYSDIIRNEVILTPVIDELDLDIEVNQLRENVTVARESDSQVFSIQVRDENPYEATEIANTISETFQTNIDEIMNVDNVTVISAATPETSAVSPNNLLNLIIGFVLGGMIGIMITFVRELLDTTVKSEDFITDEIGWTVLGQISVFSEDDLRIKTPLPKENTENQEDFTRTRRRV